MVKSLVYVLLVCIFAFTTSGCSLFGSSNDEEPAEVAENTGLEDGSEVGNLEEVVEGEGDDFPDEDSFSESTNEFVEETVGDSTGDEFASDEFGSDEYADDSFSDEEDSVSAEMQFENDQLDSIAEEIPEDTLVGNEEPDVFTDEYAEEAPVESISEEYYEDSAPIQDYAPVQKTYVSVKKMKPQAFRRANANVNRLYVVRSGDTMSSIAQKIFSSDRSRDLYSWNGHFVGKTLKVGDKVYYSSPRNPSDSRMKTFYEDGGLRPQYYNASAGENIRTIAKKLLGHERSWMEIYATNEDVDSKGRLPSNFNLRYWNGNNVPAPAPTMAKVEEVSEPEIPEEDFDAEEEEISELEEGDPNIEELAEPEEDFSEEIAENDEPEVKPPPVSRGTVSPPPTRPPAPKTIAKIPPPPPVKKMNSSFNKIKKQLRAKTGVVSTTGKRGKTLGLFIAVAVIGILLLLFSLRRGRSKRVNFTHTQV